MWYWGIVLSPRRYLRSLIIVGSRSIHLFRQSSNKTLAIVTLSPKRETRGGSIVNGDPLRKINPDLRASMLARRSRRRVSPDDAMVGNLHYSCLPSPYSYRNCHSPFGIYWDQQTVKRRRALGELSSVNRKPLSSAMANVRSSVAPVGLVALLVAVVTVPTPATECPATVSNTIVGQPGSSDERSASGRTEQNSGYGVALVGIRGKAQQMTELRAN